MAEHITVINQTLGELPGRDHGTTALRFETCERRCKYHACGETLCCRGLDMALASRSRADKTL